MHDVIFQCTLCLRRLDDPSRLVDGRELPQRVAREILPALLRGLEHSLAHSTEILETGAECVDRRRGARRAFVRPAVPSECGTFGAMTVPRAR